MPHGNGHTSHNVHSTDLGYILKYSHCHFEYIDIHIMSIACIIMGYMTISMRHVAGDWVTFNNFAMSGSMPHGNNYRSLNMHARDMVCLSMDLK